MKLQCLAVAVALLPFVGSADTAEERLQKAAAVFPEIRYPSSPLALEYGRILKELEAAKDPVIDSPNCGVLVAALAWHTVRKAEQQKLYTTPTFGATKAEAEKNELLRRQRSSDLLDKK